MADPKIEWLHTVLGVDWESSDQGSAVPDSPPADGQSPSPLELLRGSVVGFPGWDLDDGTVYADTPKPPNTSKPGQPAPQQPAPLPDPKVMQKLADELKVIAPLREKAEKILPATSTLKTLLKKTSAGIEALQNELKAGDYAAAAVSAGTLKADLNALVAAAAAQDKVTIAEATATQANVKDMVSKNTLAAKTNSEKIDLLRKLQGPATRKPELRAAQREIYKTITLEKKFLDADTKKREQVAKLLIPTEQDKAELKDKKDKWATLGDDAKLATLRRILVAHCKSMGLNVPTMVLEPKPVDAAEANSINGKFDPNNAVLHVNLGPPNPANDFGKAVDLIVRESTHYYQTYLINSLELGGLAAEAPEFTQAVLFQFNSGAGYVEPDEDSDVHKKQPLEAHARLAGSETARMVLDALK